MEHRLHEVLTAGTRAEPAQVLDLLPEDDPGPTSMFAAATGRIRRYARLQAPRTLRGESAMGGRSRHHGARHPSRPGAPTIRITGTAGFGRVRSRHAWR